MASSAVVGAVDFCRVPLVPCIVLFGMDDCFTGDLLWRTVVHLPNQLVADNVDSLPLRSSSLRFFQVFASQLVLQGKC